MKSLLYYISQGETPADHLKNIENVCRAGILWIQLRMKNTPESIVLETAQKAKIICDQYYAKLIINDHPSVAQKVNAYGLHLGLNDLTPDEARKIFKKGLIGGTANTLDDCLLRIEQQVDYIGLGPFRYTQTKEKLSPILGIEGYQTILNHLKKQNYSIPIVAIGGIKSPDFEPLLETGIDKIAVSGILSNQSSETIHSIFKP